MHSHILCFRISFAICHFSTGEQWNSLQWLECSWWTWMSETRSLYWCTGRVALPKTNISLEKLWLEDEVSFWNGPFLGYILIFRSVTGFKKQTVVLTTKSTPETIWKKIPLANKMWVSQLFFGFHGRNYVVRFLILELPLMTPKYNNFLQNNTWFGSTEMDRSCLEHIPLLLYKIITHRIHGTIVYLPTNLPNENCQHSWIGKYTTIPMGKLSW